jgi:hypothetical protein
LFDANLEKTELRNLYGCGIISNNIETSKGDSATARELYKLKEFHERTHHSKNGAAERMNRTMEVIPRATMTVLMLPEVLATKRICILQTMTVTEH